MPVGARSLLSLAVTSVFTELRGIRSRPQATLIEWIDGSGGGGSFITEVGREGGPVVIDYCSQSR